MIGERWAMLVVRELRLGPRRYRDLQAGLPGLGPSVLAQRLRDLERVGVVERRALPGAGDVRGYGLTAYGEGLEPVFTELARWAIRSSVPLEGDVTDDSVMLGFVTFFDRGSTPPWTATYDVRLSRERYVVRIVRGRLVELARREPEGPVTATIETTRETLTMLMSGERTVGAATRSGELVVGGDRSAVAKLVGATSLS